MHLFSVTTANIAINDMSLKVNSLGYIFVADRVCRSIFNHFNIMDPESYQIW